MAQGPLAGLRMVEFAGIGPVPFAAMMLADMGADVIRIDRPGGQNLPPGDPRRDILNRGRRSLALDLKAPASAAPVRNLCAAADVVLEGFRPGVMERLGFGPETLLSANPRLVYARMTGWGQHGARAATAGHDINYIAAAGALHPLGPAAAPPPPPLNLVGDFGGGALFAVAGILAALVERAASGRGQVVDAAMVDGAALLTAQVHAFRAMGFWADPRGANLLDGSSYFYRCYETADGHYLAVGAIEPPFHDAFIAGLGLDLADFAASFDRALWAARAERIAAIIRTRTRDEWTRHFAGSDACVTPVLAPGEAVDDPANVERGLFAAAGAFAQPAPAPRFARTPSHIHCPPAAPGEHNASILAALTCSNDWPAAN